MISRVLFSSKSGEWETPQDFFDALHEEFQFTLDVCATPSNAKCLQYFTREDNALVRGWDHEICWMNPPYGRGIGDWLRKARQASIFGATVVCLVPSRTDTKWWHEYVEPYAEVRFVRGRLKFGGHKTPAPFPSAVVIFRPDTGGLRELRA